MAFGDSLEPETGKAGTEAGNRSSAQGYLKIQPEGCRKLIRSRTLRHEKVCVCMPSPGA